MDNKELNKDYRQFIISRWVASEIENFKEPSLLDLENQSRYYKPLVKKFIPNRKEIDILEIGCGWGGFIYTLKSEGYFNVEAIDLIPECCTFVKNRLEVKVTCIDIFQFFKTNRKKYDVIAAFDVVEHFNKNEIVSLIKLIYESLNNGGIFIMKSPNGGSLSGLYIRYSGFTHEIAFTQLSINELFKAIGFHKIYCMPEPELNTNPIKVLLKRLLKRFAARLFSLDPNFINSANIIGVGIKSNEK